MSDKLLITDKLEGERLEAVNRMLRYHGVAEVKSPCAVWELMNHLSPMEAGRFVHIVKAITDEIDGEANS